MDAKSRIEAWRTIAAAGYPHQRRYTNETAERDPDCGDRRYYF